MSSNHTKKRVARPQDVIDAETLATTSEKPKYTKTETVEEFLARGGKIKIIKPEKIKLSPWMSAKSKSERYEIVDWKEEARFNHVPPIKKRMF